MDNNAVQLCKFEDMGRDKYGSPLLINVLPRFTSLYSNRIIDLTPYEDYFSTVELIRIPLTRRTGRHGSSSSRYVTNVRRRERKRSAQNEDGKWEDDEDEQGDKREW